MNLKDYKSVIAIFPFHYHKDGMEFMVNAEVKVDRDNQIVITMPGAKHANAFLELILTQQMQAFGMIQQPAQKGFPGDNVEVAMGPSSEDEIPNEELCMNHIPLQHRDGKEPWCRRCGRNKDYNEPRPAVIVDPRPIQFKESHMRFEKDELDAPRS